MAFRNGAAVVGDEDEVKAERGLRNGMRLLKVFELVTSRMIQQCRALMIIHASKLRGERFMMKYLFLSRLGTI